MSVKFTEEQLNNFDKAMLIQLFLNQQEQLESIDNKMQLLLEQMAIRFIIPLKRNAMTL